MSEMAKDLLTTYKYGWKTSYYQNTYDAKKDIDEPSHPIGWHDEQTTNSVDNLIDNILNNSEEEACDSCAV